MHVNSSIIILFFSKGIFYLYAVDIPHMYREKKSVNYCIFHEISYGKYVYDIFKSLSASFNQPPLKLEFGSNI